MPMERTADDIVKEIVRVRAESVDVSWQSEAPQAEPIAEDPDVRYRNDLIKKIQELTSSVQQNLSKIGKEDIQHEYVITLIDVENKLRELNDSVCSVLDGANNMARQDDDSYMEFPDFDIEDGEEEDEDRELLTGDIQYDLT